jgi:hypothetical protein
VTMASWLHPAIVTERNQAKPSESIAQQRVRLSLGHELTASKLNPATGVILA